MIERIGKIAGPEAVYVAGVGQHQMWAAQFIDYEHPGTWINSGGLGTMGFAVPAAMGAKVGRPDATVWAIDGDGCFQMTNQELATCAIEGIPIKVAIINNGSLGMVRQWQTLFYNERYSNTDLHAAASRRSRRPSRPAPGPGLRQAGRGVRLRGLRCEEPAEVDKVIEQAMAIDDRPVVVDFVVHKDAMVWPMVAAGTSNDDIKVARGMAPDLGRFGTNDQRTRCPCWWRTSRACWPGSPGLFARRGFNIDSLAVGPTEHAEISRITIVVNCEEHPLEQVTKQLNKLINVLKIVELEPGATVQRELILVKVRADADEPVAGARDGQAVPRQGGGRGAGRDHGRGDRQPGEARRADQGARAVRDQGAGPVRHGGHRPRRPLDHRPRAAPRGRTAASA